MKKKKDKDLLDILLDENNKDSITLSDENDVMYEFEQIAVIPYKVSNVEKIYAILKPLEKNEGINDDEAIVFVVEKCKDGSKLLVESDENIAKEVFLRYYDLLEEENVGNYTKLKEIEEYRHNIHNNDRDILSELRSTSNNEVIELVGPDNKLLKFRKVALFSYEINNDEKYYVILDPVENDDNYKYFSIEYDKNKGNYLKIVQDSKLKLNLLRKYAKISGYCG